jgi:hypothetical protein
MNLYCFLANTILVVHFAYVAFVVVGIVAILVGIVLRWSWVRNFWFRAVHLLLIGIVVAESVCQINCPLTDWERDLREAAGKPIEEAPFIMYWAHKLMFIDFSQFSKTAFEISYLIFGLAVFLAFVLAPPRWPRRWQKKGCV